MVSKISGRYIYDNFKIGVATHPDEAGSIYLAFTDMDNEETHMFTLAKEQIKAVEGLLREARGAGIVIAGANEMPGDRNGLG